MHFPGWIYFPDKRQTIFGHIFLWGADFCVLALSFSFSALFCLFARVFFPGCDLCLIFFSGLNSCPERTPNELRTNFGLKFVFGAYLFFGVELFGIWSGELLYFVFALSFCFSALFCFCLLVFAFRL